MFRYAVKIRVRPDNPVRSGLQWGSAFGSLWLRKVYTMRITLWAAMIVGMALWGYGLFVTGTAPLIDWKSNAPWWIADYLPNMESELGLVLVCLGSLAPYWPRQRQGPPPPPGKKVDAAQDGSDEEQGHP